MIDVLPLIPRPTGRRNPDGAAWAAPGVTLHAYSLLQWRRVPSQASPYPPPVAPAAAHGPAPRHRWHLRARSLPLTVARRRCPHPRVRGDERLTAIASGTWRTPAYPTASPPLHHSPEPDSSTRHRPPHRPSPYTSPPSPTSCSPTAPPTSASTGRSPRARAVRDRCFLGQGRGLPPGCSTAPRSPSLQWHRGRRGLRFTIDGSTSAPSRHRC